MSTENEDIWVIILEYLDVKERLKMRRTCKLISRSLISPLLWQKIEFKSYKISSLNLFINEIQCLKEITIEDCNHLNVSDIASMIDSQYHLRALTIIKTVVTDCPKMSNSNVYSLKLISCNLTNLVAKEWLYCFKDIQELDLTDNQINLDCVNLQDFKFLKTINLSRTNVYSGKFTPTLKFETIILSQCYNLDDGIFDYLKNNDSLVLLDISLNIQFSHVVSQLFDHPSLKHLHLRGLRGISEVMVERLLDSKTMIQILDPLGKWRFK
eukprot:NODE_406_length_7988_cov_0.615794.p4 type:complete len:268 gc:universal NODE_406_length_7988_cov_0.615794:2295-1492(-)